MPTTTTDRPAPAGPPRRAAARLPKPLPSVRLAAVLAVAGLLTAGAAGGVFADDSRSGGRQTTRDNDRDASRPRLERALTGNTKPSRTVEIAFDNVGKIAEVFVREGQIVAAGDPIMRQDDRAEQTRLRALERDADVQARVGLATIQRDQAKVELERTERLQRDGGVAGQVELDRARLELAAAETRILEEERQGEVAAARADEQRVIIEQKLLTSPVAGVVQKLEGKVGEVYGPQTPAVRLVTIDPLHVEVLFAGADVVSRLREDETVEVSYDLVEWIQGRVIFIEPVVDEGSQSRTFRLEIPNPDNRPAGLRMQVRLPADVASR